jgi:hypothetical protein
VPAKLYKYVNAVLAGTDYKPPEDDAVTTKHVWAV